MNMTKSMVLQYLTAMLLIALSGNSFADTCPKGSILPIPDNVKVFQQQVRASLRAALRGRGEGMVMTEVRDLGGNLPANATYCAKGSGSPLAIAVEARYVGTISVDDGKKAIGLIDIRDKEKEAILKTPAPAEMLEESRRLLAEREELRAQRPTNRYAPGYNEIGEKMHQLQLKSEQATRPHKEAMEKRVRDEVDSKYSADIQRLTYSPTATITLSANSYDFQQEPWMFVGTKGSTNVLATRVKKIAVELGTGTTAPSIVKMMQNAASPLVDRARLQAMVDGKIPTVEESTALFAQQSDDMKTGMAQKREIDKTREALEADARRARQAERGGKPATNQAASPSVTPAAAINQTQTTPSQQVQQDLPQAQTQLPPQQAPAVTPANIVNGVNILKGLFGR